MNEDGTATLGGVWDYREDPEGVVFTDLTDEDSRVRAETAEAERQRHVAARHELFGTTVQPLGSKLPT